MAERTSYEPGTPSWVDIGTHVEGAKAFYGPLFGWETQEAGPVEETGGYGFFTKNGNLVAGYGPQQNPGPPFWSTYVSVEDAEKTAAKVEEAGGTVVMAPMQVMTAGTMAVFQDPIGAFFSIWQPDEHIGAQLVNEPGGFSWNELNTRDIETAKQFYATVFGWTATTSESGPMTYTEFKLGDTTIAGGMNMPAEMPAEVPPHWLVYFTVESVDDTVEQAKGLGANAMFGPEDIPGGRGRIAVLTDPQGAAFGLYTES